jgi:hypothetical protein
MTGGAIDIDEFENAPEDNFQARNDTERIVVILDEHDDRAWKARRSPTASTWNWMP